MAVAACRNDGSTAGVTTTTTNGEGPARTYRPAGEERDLGEGAIAGRSGDGTAVYVLATDGQRPAAGCEGLGTYLYSAPLDGAARTPAIPGWPETISGGVIKSPTSDRVVIVEQCEEFFGRLLVGEEHGGLLRNVDEVPVHFSEEGAPRLRWTADGRRLIGAQALSVITIDPDSGAVTVLKEGAKAIAAGELADGTLVVLSQTGVLVGDREVPGSGWGLGISADGTSVVVVGETGLRVIDGEGKVRQLATGVVDSADWSQDGRAIAYTSEGRLRIRVLDEPSPVEVADNAYGAIFTPDGRTLLFTRYPPAEGSAATVHAVSLD